MKNSIFIIISALWLGSFTSCNITTSKKTGLFPVMVGKEYEYIDRNGKIIINPQFAEASCFRDGIALVKSSGDKGQWGYIDEKGKYLVQPQYQKATSFSENLAWGVLPDGAPMAIDKNGVMKFTLQDAEHVNNFSEGLAAFCINSDSVLKWGFVNSNGTIVINPQFSSVGKFSSGMCSVRDENNKWGYIDLKGKITINCQFDYATDFIDEIAVVSSDKKCGLIGKDGKYTINPQFDVIVIDGKKLMVKLNEKWGWCDLQGKILINPQFNDAWPFLGNKFAPIQSGDKWGYIDGEGKISINPQFDEAYPFDGDIALFKNGQQFGFINTEGKYAINPQFDKVSGDYFQGIFNEQKYASVKSEYFDINKIMGALKTKVGRDDIGGISFDSKVSELLVKFNKTQSDVKKYTKELILSDVIISKDASLKFGVSFDRTLWEEKSTGYWSSDWFFNNTIKPTFIYFQIDLHDRGAGKAASIVKATDNCFQGYKFFDWSTNEKLTKVFGMDKEKIKIFQGENFTIMIPKVAADANEVVVLVYPKNVLDKFISN